MAGQTAEQYLRERIPAHMFPGNVGQHDKVHWPFEFTVDFDFGANPVWSKAQIQEKFFQVTQEAGFLLTGISRSHTTFNSASELAPLGIDIRDRQSSRQLNTNLIPIQNIGRSSRYTQFHEPLWINPMAYVDVKVQSLIADPTGSNVSPESKMSLVFHGYRMRNPQGVRQMGTSVGKGATMKGFDHLGGLRPANVGEHGSLMWPYFFQFGLGTEQVVVMPGSGVDSYVTISQEGAFLLTHMMAVVYERTGAGPYLWTALDPIEQPGGQGYAPGLTYNLSDPQSGRVFNFNPSPIDYLGQGDFPTTLEAPMLCLPNTNLTLRYQNKHSSRVYMPVVTLFGYRLRLEDMSKIQSLTT